MLEYVCGVTLLMKKDGRCKFCGDYRPLNQQTWKDIFPMPFVNYVLIQLGRSQWFSMLDLQYEFWQIKMSPKDVKKIALITKVGLFD